MIYKEQQDKWYQEQIQRIETLKREHQDTKDVLSNIDKTLEQDILV